MIVPGPVRALAARSGSAAWLEALPGLVTELEREWGLTVGRTYGDATESWVAEATLAGGGEAVLKVFVPRPEAYKPGFETTVLRLADGEGCVRLLAADERRGALLLERLGPSLSTLGLPLRRRHEIMCAAAARLWRPAPASGLPTGRQKARGLAEQIAAGWEALDRPCTEAAVDQALAAAERRAAAHDDERAVLLHGDVHQWNTLQAPGDPAGFKLVDPDGLLGEPELDLGVLLREDLVELMAGDPYERARWLAARTGLDPAAIWDWGVLERLSNGLSCLTDGLEVFGRMSLAAADRIAVG